MMWRPLAFLSCACFLLAGCGDGDGSSGTPAPTPTPTPTYSVGGTVTGLSGTGLTLKSGADTLTISRDGSFTLPTKLANGASYNLTVGTQPNGPSQVCAVKNGAGLVASADVTTIGVICLTAPSTFAYASVPQSAASPSLGLIEYFAFDAATGRLSLQGSLAAAANTSVNSVQAAPSGIQLLVSTTTDLGSVGMTPNVRNDLTLYDVSPTSGVPSSSRLVSSARAGSLLHPNGIDFYAAGATVYHYSLAIGEAQGQSLTVIGSEGSAGSKSAISPDGKFLFVPYRDSLNNTVAKSFIAVLSLTDLRQPQVASRVQVANEASTATISPDGRLLYLTVNQINPGPPSTATGTGYVYSVSSTGGLTQIGSFSTPLRPQQAVITPAGNFLFVAGDFDSKVQGYRLDGAGGVTPVGTGIAVPHPYGLALDPDGKYLYVIAGAGDPVQEIYGFAIAADGALTPVPGSPFANGERVSSLTFARAKP